MINITRLNTESEMSKLQTFKEIILIRFKQIGVVLKLTQLKYLFFF